MFKRFFGKKNDGFFLQLEDEKTAPKPEAKAKAKDPASAKPEAVATPASVVVTAEVAPVAIAAPAATATVDKKAAQAEEKAAKAAKKSTGKSATPAPAPAPAPVSAPATAAPAITNFATDYLIKPSSISGRRMPGANMTGFLELARQVEKPKGFKAAASERKSEK